LILPLLPTLQGQQRVTMLYLRSAVAGDVRPCQYLPMALERLVRTVEEYGTGASVHSVAPIRTSGVDTARALPPAIVER
jgi:hypothetical protein